MIDGALLDAFITFAEEGGFTRGAKKRRVSQPALHAQIKRLEAELGQPLYQRVGRNTVLTPQGIEVLAFARESREREAHLRADLGDAPERPVVLAAGEGAFLYLLGPALRRHRGALRLLTRSGAAALTTLRSGEAHWAVAVGDDVPSDLEGELIARVGSMVLAPKKHALSSRRAVAMADLAGEPLIVPPPDAPHRVAIERALGASGAALTVAVEAQGWEPMLHFAQIGMGLVVVNDFCRVPPGLVAIRVRDLPTRRYWLMRRKTAHVSAAMRALRDAIVATL